MAIKRATMQDIADACGLSRNTVSKVFNDRGAVPEATKKLVLRKARDLGYYQPSENLLPAEASGGQIALLTRHKLLQHSFGAQFITSFTDHLSRSGYTLKLYEISPEEVRSRSLPPYLDLDTTAGILGIELFSREYLEMICALKKPTVIVDGYAHVSEAVMNCNFISMENVASELTLVRRMIRAGARKIGFVGDKELCNSFYERWVGYCFALAEAGLAPDPALSILAEDSDSYGDPDWLAEQLSRMPGLPDAFACANDYLAIHLMTALKKRGLSIPSDVMVTGFDGSADADLCDPVLTTAHIPGTEIGRVAASLIMKSITETGLPFLRVSVKTTPVFGGSTR